jgi:hypothetical protein
MCILRADRFRVDDRGVSRLICVMLFMYALGACHPVAETNLPSTSVKPTTIRVDEGNLRVVGRTILSDSCTHADSVTLYAIDPVIGGRVIAQGSAPAGGVFVFEGLPSTRYGWFKIAALASGQLAVSRIANLHRYDECLFDSLLLELPCGDRIEEPYVAYVKPNRVYLHRIDTLRAIVPDADSVALVRGVFAAYFGNEEDLRKGVRRLALDPRVTQTTPPVHRMLTHAEIIGDPHVSFDVQDSCICTVIDGLRTIYPDVVTQRLNTSNISIVRVYSTARERREVVEALVAVNAWLKTNICVTYSSFLDTIAPAVEAQILDD